MFTGKLHYNGGDNFPDILLKNGYPCDIMYIHTIEEVQHGYTKAEKAGYH